MQVNNKLLKIITDNPDLPIVAMVDYEVVGDGYGYWQGSISRVEVGEYTNYNDRYFDDREEFKEYFYNHNAEELSERFKYKPSMYLAEKGKYTEEQLLANELAEAKLETYLGNKAEEMFTPAIIMYIELPEDT